MEIEFDPAKDAANKAKHGLSLAVARIVLQNLIGDEIDDGDYGEERVRAYGLVGPRMLVVVYTMRGETYRIISVRKATKAEETAWLG